MDRVVAMIMAGGQGKRMDILCHVRPKPILPFAGRFRVIDFSLSNCIHSQIGDIAVLIDYQRSNAANYLERWHSANTVTETFEVLWPRNGSYHGTADAVYQNLAYLQERSANRVLILAGDHVYKMDYRKMLAFHEQMKADVTVGVVAAPIEQAYRFGTVTVATDNKVVDFVEKSETPRSNLASMGIYIFNQDILAERLIEDAAQPDSPHDFGYAIIPRMVKQDRVFAYRFDGYWQDIGTIEAYYGTNMHLIQKQPSFSLDGTWPILAAGSRLAPIKKLHQGSVENSLISPGCVIKGRVENSILSPGVWVEEQAVVRNSVLMSDVFVGCHSVIDSCVLDEEVNISQFCYIGFGAGHTGVAACTVLGKGVAVPPHTAIGRNCKILPHASHADFITNVIPSGTVISPRPRSNQILANERVTVNEH